MKNKKKRTKLKVLATAAAMVLVMGATAGSTWALTRTDYKSDFKATFVGNRNVEATIEGSSYLSTSDGAQLVEELETVTFTKTLTTSKETASFENTLAVVNVNEYAYYDFKVTNNSTSTTYTDLIIEPVFSTENTEVTTSLYYAVGEGEYNVLTEDYLTAIFQIYNYFRFGYCKFD